MMDRGLMDAANWELLVPQSRIRFYNLQRNSYRIPVVRVFKRIS